MKNDDLYVYKKSDFYEDFISSQKEYYEREQVDTLLAEKDKEIVELQKQVDELDGVKKSAELILMKLLDCGLIKEWYFNGKFNAVLKADDPHLKIAELKQKLENVNELIKTARQMLEDAKATEYAEMVDAGMRERGLKRALYNLRACYADMMQKRYIECKCDGWVHRVDKWIEVERKCRAKAEQYK